MSTSTVGTLVQDVVTAVGSVLTSNLGAILAVFAGLVGLGILIYYVRRFIGHK